MEIMSSDEETATLGASSKEQLAGVLRRLLQTAKLDFIHVHDAVSRLQKRMDIFGFKSRVFFAIKAAWGFSACILTYGASMAPSGAAPLQFLPDFPLKGIYKQFAYIDYI